MAKKNKKTRRDTAEIARDTVEQAIGGKLSGGDLPCDEQEATPDTPSAGPSEGGKARAEKLSKTRRSEIARRAAQKRWGYDSDESGSSSGQ